MFALFKQQASAVWLSPCCGRAGVRMSPALVKLRPAGKQVGILKSISALRLLSLFIFHTRFHS